MTALVCFHDNKGAEAVQAARELGVEQIVGVALDCEPSLSGVESVTLVERPYEQEVWTEAVWQLCQRHQSDTVLAVNSRLCQEFLPRLAARMSASMCSGIVAVTKSGTFRREMYSGRATAEVSLEQGPRVLTLKPGAFSGGGSGEPAPVHSLVWEPPNSELEVVRTLDQVRQQRTNLEEAKVVVCGGRGLGSRENFERLVGGLADALGAGVAATMPAVQLGFAPYECQVGQTGKCIWPQLYIAIGVSGAIEHLCGMKDSAKVVAINQDSSAPIFQNCDYGLVGDLFDIVPRWITLLEGPDVGCGQGQ